MTSSISSASGRSPITLAAGFLGAFVVGSLAVQLVRSQTASVQAGAADVEPVIASPATLAAISSELNAYVAISRNLVLQSPAISCMHP